MNSEISFKDFKLEGPVLDGITERMWNSAWEIMHMQLLANHAIAKPLREKYRTLPREKQNEICHELTIRAICIATVRGIMRRENYK
jgi:hypothetical protein